MVNAPDRVLVWSTQLRNNDFPPVCAVTGRPAETWRRFRFTTAPGWAYLFLFLICIGIRLLLIFIVMAVVSRRATGYLPLTRDSSRYLTAVTWIGGGLFILVGVLWIAGLIVASAAGPDSSAASGASGLLFVLGLLVLFTGVTNWLVVKPLFGPRGNVKATRPGEWDNLVEISHVRPAFVVAVQQHQQLRASQAMPPPPPPPSPILPA